MKMGEKKCKVKDCKGPVSQKGLCASHQWEHWKTRKKEKKEIPQSYDDYMKQAGYSKKERRKWNAKNH